MTCEVQNTQFDMAMELLIDNGLDGMADAISMLMNTAMQIERSRYLQAEPYERTELRRSHASPRALKQESARSIWLYRKPGMEPFIPAAWNEAFDLRGP